MNARRTIGGGSAFNGLPRVVVACASGALAASAWLLGPSLGQGGEPGPVAAWATDRDRCEVVGLDRDLLIARRVPIPWPTEIEATRGGGAWAVACDGGDPLGPHRLMELSPAGRVLSEHAFGPVLDLTGRDAIDALLVELQPASTDRVWRVEPGGARRLLAVVPEALCVGAQGELALVGSQTGRLTLVSSARPGEILRVIEPGGVLQDVAPGPRAGQWWALDASGAQRLLLLDRDLSTLSCTTLHMHGLHLAPVRGEERVWIADSTEPLARRFGPGGVLEVEARRLPLSGLDRAAVWRGSGVLLAAPGALLRLDGAGALAPGQGGFDFLVGVSAVPR